MLLDEWTEFCDAASVVAAAGTTTLIGDTIDLDSPEVSPNTVLDLEGSGVYLVIQTDTEIITGGAAGSIQFFLVSDALATLGGGVVANCTTHIASAVLVTDDAAANSAQLNAGGVIYCGKLPTGSYEKYLGILCTVTTTDVTAGKINAFLTSDPALWRPYADNVS